MNPYTAPTTSHDYDYSNRLNELASLMLAHPMTKMKKLQKSALRAYPVTSKELTRHCYGARFAFKAADIANKSIQCSDFAKSIHDCNCGSEALEAITASI